jgi:hypothetical protein
MSVDRVDGLDPARRAATAAAPHAPKAGTGSFADALKAQLGPLRLSSHAAQRIQRREIAYDEPVAARLEAAVNQAAAKGHATRSCSSTRRPSSCRCATAR